MTANPDAVLSGIAAPGAGGFSLAHFAPKGTALPTTVSGALDAAFVDPGMVTEDGLKKAVSMSTNEIKAYGSRAPVRVIKTERKTSFSLTFLETNQYSLAIYNSLALNAISVATDGSFSYTEGGVTDTHYAAVFDMVDGSNLLRGVARDLVVSDAGEVDWKAGDPLTSPVTVTALPGSDGVAIFWYALVPALSHP